MDRKKTALAHALALLMCASSSATYAHSITMNSAKLNTLSASPEQHRTLIGSGYLANARYPMQHCLKDSDVILSNMQAELSIQQTTDMDDLAQQLDVDVSSNIGWGKFSMSAAAKYIRALQSNTHSLHFTYLNTISTDAAFRFGDVFGEDALNSTGLALFRQGVDEFIATCGDTYVDQVRLGATLAVTLQVNFKSQLQKTQFEASFKGKIDTLSETYISLNQALQDSGSSASIEILAFQMGGKPMYLNSVLGANKNGHHLVHCSASQQENCVNILDDVTAYAQASGAWDKTGFTKQIQLDENTLRAESLHPVQSSYARLSSYRNFGIPIPKKTISPEAIAARKKLNMLYDQNKADVSFSESIVNSTPFPLLEQPTQFELKRLASMLKADSNTIQSPEAIECFLPETQENCPQIVNNIENRLHAPDMTKLNKLRGAYYVNINGGAPYLFTPRANGNNALDIYGINIEPSGIQTHNLGLIYNPNFKIIAPRGGYSTYDLNHKQTRFYIDYYGQDDWLYQDASGLSYFGLIPWDTCINGYCSKAYNSMYVVPF
ncbi:MAG: hypothetical protein P1U36_10260 [Legionellaceae bacterium]|nr:hypothetical protein [Legionellaceae bacterium]